MQQNLMDNTVLNKIIYLVGDSEVLFEMNSIAALKPFDNVVVEYLNDVSKIIMRDPLSKVYPDIITLAFWMRKSSVEKIKQKFVLESNNVYLGRGIAFHVAPSNVPVNYAYSLISGLLTGNTNIVRIPSKNYPQVAIINNALKLGLELHTTIKPYICLIRYERDREINDFLSAMADTRIIWGGNATIADIRESKIPPRSGEITFADRFSMAVIDSNEYMKINNKEKISRDFYNDTYLSDQNACTSPRIVIWTGNNKEEAKELFWDNLHLLVKKKYSFQSIQGINKLTSAYLFAVSESGAKIMPRADNYIVRVKVSEINYQIMNFKDNSGFFFEYDCDDILDLRPLCNDTKCQTIAYIGCTDMFLPLIYTGVKGIDRIVPIGKTMDFEFIWDGYNLYERLTRIIKIDH